MLFLTVCHEFEQHFYFRQRVEAGEFGALGAAGLGRLLPASCFCFGQQPVAEAVVRPPAVSAICTNVPPVFCAMERNPDRKSDESTSFSNADSQVFALLAADCVREARGFTPPGAQQLWRLQS